MDIFKLLTRSSNLQKSGSVVGHQQIPSAGFNPGNYIKSEADYALSERPSISNQRKNVPAVLAADDHAVSESSITSLRRSKKRKRVDDSHVHGLNEQDAQDFPLDSHERKIPMIDNSRMDETECRRILKQHKLKITLLNRQPTSGRMLERREKKEKPPHQNHHRKNTFTPLTPTPLTSFKHLRTKYAISKRLAENLDHLGYLHPTEVQMGSLPILLGTDEDRGLSTPGPTNDAHHQKRKKSEIDLLTVAPTGSGKTLAFLIHVIQGLLEDPRWRKEGDGEGGGEGGASKRKERAKEREVRALIIAPTHELADQIVNEGRKIMVGTGLRISGLKKGAKLGLASSSLGREVGEAQCSSQVDREDLLEPDDDAGSHGEEEGKEGPLVKTDVLVSTPMALVNSISSTSGSPLGSTSSSNALPGIRYLILDEADILLDPLFRAQTLSIWSACSNPRLRTSLWSATIGSSVESLAISFISERRRNLNLAASSSPTHHHIIRLIVGLKDSAVSNISHRLIYTATEQGKLLALRQMIHPAAASAGDAPSIQPPFLIFTQTIPRAIALHSELLYDIPLEAGGSSRIAVLHSDLSITARAAIMAGFRRGEIWILITTDLLSRGVDFRGVNGVVNYDIPNTGAAYIHRVGRTGRQQREGGIAVTFYTKEDIPYVKNIANVISRSERERPPLTSATSATSSGGGKAEGKAENNNPKHPNPPSMEKWLLTALPSIPRKLKKELKHHGVESRRSDARSNSRSDARSDARKDGGRTARKMRISTKSGYERQLEQRRKDAVEARRRRNAAAVAVAVVEEGEGEGEEEGEEWRGIVD